MSKRRAIEDGGDGAAAGGAEPGLPRFKAVKAAITAALIAGEWTSGAAIPDQARLAGRYRVSIGTLRKAIDELVAESILVRRQGLGTYVAAHGPQRNRFHFFHIVDADGTRAIPEPELIAFTRGRADAQQAAALQVDNGARIYTITNLLRLAGEPAVLDTIVIAAQMFPGLTRHQFGHRESTIYSLYQTKFGINVVRTHERLRAASADRQTAAMLETRAGAPVLEIHRVAYTYRDVPVELRRSSVNTAHRFYEANRGKAEGSH